MATASGFVLMLSNERMSTFLECVDEGLRFAEPVAEFQHSRNMPLICFIVHDRAIAYIGLGRRGLRAGTDLSRLNIDRVEALAPPLSVRRILTNLPTRIAASVRKRFDSGGLLTEKGFAALVETIRRLAPQASTLVERFSHLRNQRISALSHEARSNLAQQKEAVLTALNIAGLSRDSVQEWTPSEERPESFLDGLPNARLREDQMVVNDLMKLPGFTMIRDSVRVTGAAVFESENGRERLTIILANRLPLEQQTGTDLIYFNETFQSFVMVQYKAMEREDRSDGLGQAVFRLPDDQLREEIARMDELLGQINACEPNSAIDGFRLTENPFFLKLCSRIVFNPDDVSLVPGMYLPLDYWKLLEGDPGIRGPRGGLRVSYENAKRHFDNTEFATIVSKAWVGTTPSQSQQLQEVIRETLETGKAVAIAIKPRRQRDSDAQQVVINDVTQDD